MEPQRRDLAVVMSGGGALAAYQAGCLSAIAAWRPALAVPILTGVSAGAINAAVLASASGTFERRVGRLVSAWREIQVEEVFRVATWSLWPRALKWGLRLASGGARPGPRPRSFVDTQPLRAFLERTLCVVNGDIPGIERNLRDGELDAIAVTASSYRTGQSVTWMQAREPETRERAHRVSVPARLTIDHVLASAALPLLFPAVRVGDAWYGDGGILLTAPLSPAVRLGAGRVLAISTRCKDEVRDDADAYPPPAQVAGALLNALFLDQIDADALRLQRINDLIEKLPEQHRRNLRPVELMVLRPSRDLGDLANRYEPRLPRALRFLTRGLGTRETRNHDMLSMLMFQHDFIDELLEQGRADAEARRDELEAFLAGAARPAVEPEPRSSRPPAG